jgi:hypothetical protein
LSKIQDDLEDIYRLDRTLNVNDFVLPKSSIEAPLDRLEQVLVCSEDDDLSMSLVLDDSLMVPGLQWNLDTFCVATEGVSHVLYLANAAQQGQRISAFELELQAEIDKFLVLVTAVGMECKDALKRLFASSTLDTTVVATDEAERYRRANRTAWSFCRQITLRFLGSHRVEQRMECLLREVREVYRMRGTSKLERLSGYRLAGGR